jgi:hypothetical protein
VGAANRRRTAQRHKPGRIKAVSNQKTQLAQPSTQSFVRYEGDRATITISSDRIRAEEKLIERLIAYAFDTLNVSYIELRIQPAPCELAGQAQ